MATELTRDRSEGTTRTPAMQRILEKVANAEELFMRDEWPYPNHASFVPSDVPEAGKEITRDLREMKTVILVYPDGTERWIEPREPGLLRRRRLRAPRLVGRLLRRAPAAR